MRVKVREQKNITTMDICLHRFDIYYILLNARPLSLRLQDMKIRNSTLTGSLLLTLFILAFKSESLFTL